MSKGIHSAPHKLLGAEAWDALVARAAAVGLATPGERGFGAVVTDHRSSWVRRTKVDTRSLFIKTYDYPSSTDRWRGVGRNTWLAPSRAHREAQALRWLSDRGLGQVATVAVVEWRTPRWLGSLGLLRRAVLVTEAWPGTAADQALAALGTAERTALLDALTTYAERLHAQGFRDGNLDLRNLLVQRDASGAWRCTKIDSPRWRLCARQRDAAARADWDRLVPQLAKFATPAWTAALRERLSRG